MEKKLEKEIGGYTKDAAGGVVNMEVRVETEIPGYPIDEKGDILLGVTDKAEEKREKFNNEGRKK